MSCVTARAIAATLRRMSDDEDRHLAVKSSSPVSPVSRRSSAQLPQVIGLLGANGIDWAVAQLAAWMSGKTVVPMPTFFSRLQLEHVLRDAGIDSCGCNRGCGWTRGDARRRHHGNLEAVRRKLARPARAPGMIVYTSGSTGRPKGVRLGIEQIDWQARALAEAIGASPADINLSLLPLAFLLETITAICVPVLVGARTHFASAVAENVGAGRPADLLAAFETVQPTTAVLVPQLLSGLVAQLEARNARAPESLRFVAVGGARVSESSDRARLGARHPRA